MVSEEVLQTMRVDCKVVGDWYASAENWTAEEVAEIGAGVKRAKDRNDAPALESWAAWLAKEAEWIRRHIAAVRGAEARIKAEQAAMRKEAA